jgi:hypothetical protein
LYKPKSTSHCKSPEHRINSPPKAAANVIAKNGKAPAKAQVQRNQMQRGTESVKTQIKKQI